MTAQHTPGEWIAVGAWVEHVDDNRADICSCDPRTIDHAYLGRSYDEMVANAALIAAAPDLLAALKVLVDNGGIGPESMFDDARAAIAKATGGAA